MVLCENEQSLGKSYTQTKSRAMAYFGSEEVFIEKYLKAASAVNYTNAGTVEFIVDENLVN